MNFEYLRKDFRIFSKPPGSVNQPGDLIFDKHMNSCDKSVIQFSGIISATQSDKNRPIPKTQLRFANAKSS